MRIINTAEIDINELNDWEAANVYNAMDVLITHDIFASLVEQLDPVTKRTYNFSKSLLGPVLEMNIRGLKVDFDRRAAVLDECARAIDRLEAQLEKLVFDGVGMHSFNWRSPADLRKLFHEKLLIPPIMKQGHITIDDNAREKIAAYPSATQLVKHINALSYLAKRITTLKTSSDTDGRTRTSYNIAGTSTGRFSSSENELGSGGNLQNITESLRSIYVADPGMKFAKFDAKSGESFCVGALLWRLFRDPSYLDVCESGDIHTNVAKMVWRDLPWTGNLKKDKDIAEQKFHRHFTYRFMCKKLGHGSNYGATPATLSEEAKIPLPLAEQFQRRYFEAFPGILRWHEHVRKELIEKGWLINLTGRRRHFMKRRNDPKILREALAFDPQGSLADIVNRAMLRLWREGYTIVANLHDALVFMYPAEAEASLIPELLAKLIEPIPIGDGRELQIPYDAKVGWNLGEVSEDNPNGLAPWTGADLRRPVPSLGLLDQVIR